MDWLAIKYAPRRQVEHVADPLELHLREADGREVVGYHCPGTFTEWCESGSDLPLKPVEFAHLSDATRIERIPARSLSLLEAELDGMLSEFGLTKSSVGLARVAAEMERVPYNYDDGPENALRIAALARRRIALLGDAQAA